ncbi:hypothetical protein D7W82_05985 [Corallococcus sp. CA049B]|uniref:hypothetical protein n=1 Tax=Corallococcus sp. CA049B TaxID=2316730 RepID=UPI000EA140FD|nr:hypothetical protein [Corallococcus sp. CA049B]RKG89831.1 hypothetical protein D7W82_05985 [Corallococcus sp. CA049B]
MEKRMAAQLAETPKEAFGNYIRELEDSYLRWYARASYCNKILFVVLQGTAIVAGLGTAVIAGKASDLEDSRFVLVLLPLLAAFATGLLEQTRVRQVLALRENGREQVQRLISDAKAAYAAAPRDADQNFTQLHMKLVDEISRIERQQAFNVLSIVSARPPEQPALKTREKEHQEDGRPVEGAPSLRKRWSWSRGAPR